MDRDQSLYGMKPRPGSPGMPSKMPQELLELTPEMTDKLRKVWSDCIKSSFYVAGIPFAVSWELLNSYLERIGKIPKPTTMKPIIVRSVYFGMKVFFGMILYSPVCYSKIQEEYMTYLKNNPDKVPEGMLSLRGLESSQIPDTSSDKNWDASLSQSDSTFSHLDMDTDQSSSDNLIMEEKEEVKPRADVTYEELRRRNRENYKRSLYAPVNRNIPPSSSWQGGYYEDSQKPSVQNSPPPPPPEPVKKTMKNKYGDEIEL